MPWRRRLPGKPWKRTDIADRVFTQLGGEVSRDESLKLVTMVFDEIFDSIARKESVHITGFGSFRVFAGKGIKKTRNAMTGERHITSGHWEIRFRSYAVLKRLMNPGVYVYKWYKNRFLRDPNHASSSSSDDALVQAEDAEHPNDG